MPKRRRRGDGYRGSQRVPPEGRGGDALALRIRLRERESAAQASDRKRYFAPCVNAGTNDAEERKAKAVPPKHSCGWALGRGEQSPRPKVLEIRELTAAISRHLGASAPDGRVLDAETAMMTGRGGGWLPKLGHPFALICPAGWRPCRDTLLVH